MKDALGHGSNGGGAFNGVVKSLLHAFVTNGDAANALSSGPKSAHVLVHQSMQDRGWSKDTLNDLSAGRRRLARALM
jgi:hypothetical protein